MKKLIPGLALSLSTLLATTLPTSAVFAVGATPDVVEENAQERINFAGKLRMLSQRIPAAACHMQQGVDQDGTLAILNGAIFEFEQIVAGLQNGDADLNIQAPETRRMTLAKIAELQEVWAPFEYAAVAVASGNATEADFQHLYTENTTVLATAQQLVEELTKQYSNPNAVAHRNIMLVDISGRQRMLLQRMSKQTCMINSGQALDDTMDQLNSTMGIFEASLSALRLGMQQVGIMPPPTSEISAALEVVANEWSSVKPHVTTVLEGGTLDAAASGEKFAGLNTTMARMNDVVGLYAAISGSSE